MNFILNNNLYHIINNISIIISKHFHSNNALKCIIINFLLYLPNFSFFKSSNWLYHNPVILNWCHWNVLLYQIPPILLKLSKIPQCDWWRCGSVLDLKIPKREHIPSDDIRYFGLCCILTIHLCRLLLENPHSCIPC